MPNGGREGQGVIRRIITRYARAQTALGGNPPAMQSIIAQSMSYARAFCGSPTLPIKPIVKTKMNLRIDTS